MREVTEETKEERRYREDSEKIIYWQGTMLKFNRYCVVCYPHDTIFGVTVHEVYPRSQHPTDWWKIPDNGCPLCQEHHDYVHSLSTEEGIKYCKIHMEKCLRGLGRK